MHTSIAEKPRTLAIAKGNGGLRQPGIEFLDALTDPARVDNRDDVPASVPSGLTLAE